MIIQKILSILLLGVFTLSACAPAAGVQPTQMDDEQTDLFDQEWVLQSFGKPGSEVAVITDSTVTLTLGSDGNASGSSGCNSFGGVYEIAGDQIAISEIVSTLMACLDDAIMQQETQYIQALQSAGTFSVSGEALTIEYNDGEGVLNFVKASALPTPTATAAPMSLSGGSTLSTSSFAGLAAFALISAPIATAQPPAGSSPVSTAEPPAGSVPIATSEPDENTTWYSDKTYLDDRSTATGLIKSYFNAIHRKEYLRAYSYWRDPAKSLGLFTKYAAGYKETESVRIRIGQVGEGVVAGSIYYSVPALIKVQTTTGERQRFIACFVLQFPQPSFQGKPPFIPMGIERATVRLVRTPGSGGALLASACGGSDNMGNPLKPAPVTDRNDTSARNYLDDRSDPTQVIRSLVNAINRKEYVRAYSYWEQIAGSANVPPFNQFTKGYAETEKVQLFVGVVQGDAGAGQFYYSVPVVMIATTTREVVQTFAGCYVLHLSNPALQATPPFMPLAIRSADVQQVPNRNDPIGLLAGACKP